MALIALLLVAVAENGRIPVDNPATHLELTMVHEAMILEYSGRHLALIEWAAALKLTMYLSLIACIFFPWGIATPGSGAAAYAIGTISYAGKLLVGGFLLAPFETSNTAGTTLPASRSCARCWCRRRSPSPRWPRRCR